MLWKPRIYNNLKALHHASFEPLQKLVSVRPKMRVIDMGCGTGELTHRLANYLPDADILGIDSSPEMLQGSKAFTRERLRFERRSVEEEVKSGTTWDLVFSHQVLHWIDDHRTFFPRLINSVAKGGQLAVLMAIQDAYFFERDLDVLTGREPFLNAMQGWTRKTTVLNVEEYATILFEKGATDIVAFEKVFPEVLRDADEVFDFAAGTALLQYQKHLPLEHYKNLEDAFSKTLREKYPQKPVFFPFKKIFLSATF